MATIELPIGRPVSLEDRYRLDEGRVLLTGVQALVRLAFDQLRADRRDDLRTGALVSGYQGSPLGGLDLELGRQREVAEELGLVHRPAINEELGATAVWGSQLVSTLEGPRVDGVLGMWYGKAPGVDRAGDALRHGNFVGAHPRGGMLALAGDDPQCKSSTLPSASESVLAALGLPVFYPGSPQEVLDLGRHAIAASRASGLWVGVKIATNVADGVATVEVGPDRVRPVVPIVEDGGRPYVHVPSGNLVAPHSLEMERTLRGPRLALAHAYARENGINRITLDAPGARIGFVAAGTVYHDLREALRTLGLDDDALRARGVRLLKLGMISPLERDIVREFARGLEEIVVVEDKGPFLQTAIRDALYDLTERPRVEAAHGPVGTLDADAIARAVGSRLPGEEIAARLAQLEAAAELAPVAGAPTRTPFFCSGCPHNRSTEAPEGSAVGAGIGCHTMIVLSPEGKGKITGTTQMGSEGAQWIGQAPFTDTPHLFQNLGDGTFSHSGSLAIRAAVASGVNITYKLLYNGAVAMTGGQAVQGVMPVPELTRWLQAEGVRRIVVTTEDTGRYDGATLAPIAELRDRSRLLESQRELRAISGVTVLIHDQACAAERRRLRKRGQVPDPPKRVAINERVCEGCGDCGRKSHCLSVLPVDTEFGSKTRIHQSSCNKDYSCLDGDCPSFLTVIPGRKAKRAVPRVDADLPDPEVLSRDGEATLRLIGIGGTGVVTMAQIIGMAALLDGKRTAGLDQTGLAQKGGAVISDVRIVRDGERAGRAPAASVDAYLGFDLLGAASAANLATADPSRTVAVVSTSQTPTGDMIGDPSASLGAPGRLVEAIEARTQRERNVYLDAQDLAGALFGDHMPANTIVLGAAWQRGLVPLSLPALEEAFRLNGAAVEKNLAAFAWGRAAVARPELLPGERSSEAPSVSDEARALIAAAGARPGSELERLLTVRVPDLIAYQSAAYARRYVDFVARVVAADGGGAVSEAVARHLHRLLAYKDEYEVARLHLDPAERERIAREFGPDAKLRYMLHPPLLRALGLKRKLALGTWFDPAFKALRGGRRLRGTPFDLFGYARVRRVERTLPGEYEALVERALPHLGTASDQVLEICELPDAIRGYEEIKLGNVETFRSRAAELEARLGSA